MSTEKIKLEDFYATYKACENNIDEDKNCVTCFYCDIENNNQCLSCYNSMLGLPVNPTKWKPKEAGRTSVLDDMRRGERLPGGPMAQPWHLKLTVRIN